MLRYVATRFAIWIPSVLLVMLAVYALAFYGAGDPIKLIFLRAPGDVAYNPQRIEAIRESAGLNKPFIEQFAYYVWNLAQGKFGNSLSSGRSVWALVKAAAPVSFQLALCSVILTALVAIPLGMIAALNQNTRIDYTILGSALFLWAIPAYVAGPLLMVALIVLLPGVRVPYGWGGIFDVRILLPLVVLSFQPIALIVRQTRAAVIEVLSEDFIRTARAKGMTLGEAVWRHGVRNALLPVLTILGLQFAFLVAGVIIVENVFYLPGLGRLIFTAISERDLVLVRGVTIVLVVGVTLTMLITDLCYALVDPRLREGGAR